jgi:hypothetical protein
MLPTSGTFNFQSIQIELIIREAFERIGILGEFVEPQKLDSAKRSIDLLLLEWMNKSINLWTLEISYLPLVTARVQYTLPVTVSDIIQANLRTSTRQLDGVAASSDGGIAADAFDGDPLTACTQNAANGNISYDYGMGKTQQINFVGVQSNVDRTYNLIIESSVNNIDWLPLINLLSLDFVKGVNVWFDVPTPVDARAYRIRETGRATLDIQEIYFNNNIFDMPISNVSRYEYLNYPNKRLESRPSIYYLNRQITPILNLWPAPSNQYNCLQYSYKQMIQDAGAFYNNALEIPSRFYPALIWGLSYQLALKYNPQVAGAFKGEYEQSFNLATISDSESVNISIRGDEDYGEI